MALTRYNPRREISLWNDALFDPWFNTRSSIAKQAWWDIGKEKATLELNMAGFDKEDISVRVRRNNMLHVSSNRNGNRFASNYSLPQDSLPETLTARLERGILTIEVSLENSEREIEIL